MIESALDGLAWLHGFSDPLAVLVVGAFVAGALAERYDRDAGRWVVLVAWVVFAVFWLSLIYHYGIEKRSFIEGIGTVVAAPASIYAGYLLANGRDTLFVLSRAVAVMGLIYLPFQAIPALEQLLIETVTTQTGYMMSAVGFEPNVVIENHYGYEGYRNTFKFYEGDHPITYTILLACTGLGSIAIMGGLIAAVRAPLRRKLRALAVSAPVIYVLNLVRNTFISIGFGEQLFHVHPDLVMSAFAIQDPYLVSYYVADRMIAQSLSVVAMVAITWLVVRELPEVLTVVEDVVFMATGAEYDLTEAFAGQPVRADGAGGPETGTE